MQPRRPWKRMDKSIYQGPFVADVSIRDGIVLRRENARLQISAAEVEPLIGFLCSIMAVEGFAVLPSRLQSSPFEALFKPNRTVELRRFEMHPDAAGLSFTFIEGDKLINLAKLAGAKLVDRTTIRGRVQSFSAYKTPDTPIDGR